MVKYPRARKYLAIVIILLFVGTCNIPGIAQDTDKLLPSSSGHWLYVGGSGPGNYTRIQDAINAASPGDTVFVFNGIYYENVKVNKSLNLLSKNRMANIFGDGTTPCLTITANKANISGFMVRNGNGIGIALESSENIIINNILDNASVNIFAYEQSSNNMIYHNIFSHHIVTSTHNAVDYGTNKWDNGYHFGGNYWDDYTGYDLYHGPNQNIPGSDGKGDTPYAIYGGENKDNYPYMYYDGWLNTSLISDFTYVYTLPRGRIEFFDQSIAINCYIVNWFWEFGDGTTSMEQNPIHQYAPEDKTYLVNLTVTDENGSSDTITKKVIIGPIADAGGPYTGYVNQEINFNGSGSYNPYGTIIMYEWDFGDGNSGSGEHPIHYYTSPGVYTVYFTVTDNNGSTGVDSTLAEITLNVLYVGGSGPGNYTRIQDAIDNSIEGGTVFVYKGIYSDFIDENWACVYIRKSIYLVGEDKYHTIINGTGIQRVITIRGTGDVNISGFTIQNGGSQGFGYGIEIYRYPNINIFDNIIIHNMVGIEFEVNTLPDTEIQNENTIIGNIHHNIISYNGIGIEGGIGNSICKYNIISHNSVGMDCTGLSGIISNNHIEDNGIGIITYNVHETTISYNNFISNTEDTNNLKVSPLISSPRLLSYKINWVGNYWDEGRITPKPIRGTTLIYIQLFFAGSFIEITIAKYPYFQYDRHPAKEPYDIPG